MVIGKGGETIRSLESEYEVQIDIEEDGTILVYATEGTKGDAAIAAIAALTKEPEVGDQYTGKVVKTTDFGAFVELKKGTDGLLHVSNVGPGRVNHIEDVIARGDILDVLVQEVDKARGRIGLKLVQKHENGALVSPEELVERAKNAPPREPREERPRGDRDRRGAVAVVAARAASARSRTASRSGSTVGGMQLPPRLTDGAVVLRQLEEDDRADVLRHDARPARPSLAEHAGTSGGLGLRPPQAHRRGRACRGDRYDYVVAAAADDVAVGAVVASRRHRDNFELAYFAGEAGRGRGLMSQAVRVLCEALFAQGVGRLEVRTHPANADSQRVALARRLRARGCGAPLDLAPRPARGRDRLVAVAGRPSLIARSLRLRRAGHYDRRRAELEPDRARLRRACDLRAARPRSLGRGRLLDRCRFARRGGCGGRGDPLHRAPPVQGNRASQRARDRRDLRRARRRAERGDVARAHTRVRARSRITIWRPPST